MRPLTTEETALKEEMKARTLCFGVYTDPKAKDKFNMLCHLEDFEMQYWELEKIVKDTIKYVSALQSDIEINSECKSEIIEKLKGAFNG